jgi:hypothetical protein
VPPTERAERERIERKTAEHRPESGAVLPEVAQHVAHRRGASRGIHRTAAPRWFVHRGEQQQPEQEVRHRQDQKHQLPPMQLTEYR